MKSIPNVIQKLVFDGIGQPLSLRPACIAQFFQVGLLRCRLLLAQTQGASLSKFQFLNHIRYRLFLTFIALIFVPFFSLSGAVEELLLRDNLVRAQPGDYLVTAQNKNYSVLIIRDRNNEYLSLEEITIPMSFIPNRDFSWRKWVKEGAKGHTCWVMYKIYLPDGSLQQVFSYTRNEWGMIPESQNFLTKLLNLRLKKVPLSERKKVGPPPASDSYDRRAYWQPKVIVDGKIVEGVAFDAWRTKWPKDGTELSGKIIEVYLPKDNEKYPSYFPYWLQVSGIIGNAKVRIVDSGIQLFSSP